MINFRSNSLKQKLKTEVDIGYKMNFIKKILDVISSLLLEKLYKCHN